MNLLVKTASFLRKCSLILGSLLSVCSAAEAAEGILDYNRFMSEIEPIITTRTFTSPGPAAMTCVGCHGNTAHAAYTAMPLVVGESRNNFTEVARNIELDDPDTSRILLKPLAIAAGGVPHGTVGNTGGEQFSNTSNDSAYISILQWIEAATTSSVGASVSRTEAYPNPFRFNTDIVYFLTTPAQQVKVMLFSMNGKQLQTFNGTGNVGANRVRWDGRNVNDEQLPTGVYFYVVKAQFEDGESVKKGQVVYTP